MGESGLSEFYRGRHASLFSKKKKLFGTTHLIPVQLRHLLTLVLISICTLATAQIKFEKGYYIDSTGIRTDGWIRNVGWKYAPKSFVFKSTETSEAREIQTSKLAEFAAGSDKYIRRFLQYDKSSQEQKDIGVTSNPEWANGNLTLKVLVDGKAKLYHYLTSNYSLFFYSTDGGAIEQLVFKNYLTPEDRTQMAVNRMYLAQLNTKVRCGSNPPVKERTVTYTEASLKKHFRSYNTCMGDVAPVVESEKKSSSVRITTGVNMMKVGFVVGSSAASLGQATTPRLGADLDFALPFGQNKWSVVVEPNLSMYQKELSGNREISFQLIEVPIGLRHKFFFAEQSYLFVNGMVMLDFPITHNYQLSATSTDKVSKGAYGFAAGLGFAYKKFSIEARYYPAYDRVLGPQVYYQYEKTSIIAGFKIF